MSVGPIDLRRPDALELVRAGRVALLLGDIPGPMPAWYRLHTAPSLPKGQYRPKLDDRQRELVRIVEEVRARRANARALPPVVEEVEAEWVEDEQ